MSNRWLVYITVHTTCRMRLYNNRLWEQGRCKQCGAWVHTLRLVVSHRSWWQICFPAVCYLFYEIQTLSVIHPINGLPLDPLPDERHTHHLSYTETHWKSTAFGNMDVWKNVIFVYLSSQGSKFINRCLLCTETFTCCTPAVPERRCAYWNIPGVFRWRSWC